MRRTTNAGVAGPYLPLDEYPAAEFLRVLQVDLVGVWHCKAPTAQRALTEADVVQ
jgi:NAD(P)-dependent dehydrogenase (short-subunit alcohol dehydrogenase family)